MTTNSEIKFRYRKITLLAVNIFLFIFFNTSLYSQQKTPSIIWQKCFGGSKNETLHSIVKTDDGAYIMAGSSYSNDGDVSGHHGSTDSSDAWIIKVSSSGDLLWQKSYGGTGNETINSLSRASDGGYIAFGYTTSNNDGDVSGYHGGIDIWILKLDANGNLQWQKCLGGSSRDAITAASVPDNFGYQEASNSALQTNDGGYILVGSTASNDGDVSVTPTNMWIVKLSSSGAVEWQKGYDIGYDGYAHTIIQLASGGYAIGVGTGMSGSTLFPAIINLETSYLAILDATGNLVSANTYFSYGGSNLSLGSYGPINILRTNGNQYFIVCRKNVYPTGQIISDAVDITRCDSSFLVLSHDPVFVSGLDGINIDCSGIIIRNDGSGVFAGYGNDPTTLNYHGNQNNPSEDAFLANFSPVGWRRNYGGSGRDIFCGIVAENDYTYITAGITNSNDGDVSGNKGGYDFWVVKLGNTNLIRGTVFADYNSDGIKENNEPFVNGILVQSKKGDSTISGSVYNGIYINFVDTGTYTTSVLTPNPYYKAFPASHVSMFSSYSNSDSISFAVQPIPGKRDYRVYIEGPSASAHTLDSTYLEYYLNYFNDGTDTLVNRSIKFIKDSNESFLSADVAPSSIHGDTITWNISSPVPPEKFGGFGLKMHFNIASGKTIADYLGDTLVSTLIIDTTGDLNTSNNIFVLRQPILSSFDPNNKQEANAGSILSSDVSDGKYLYYTIDFQNTGNDTAYNIVITDTLSPKLDYSSLEMVNSSNPHHLSIVNGNKCSWTFTNIKLPDSLQNESASHGFITYRIKPAITDVKGDTILNTAFIVFDYNLPIVTNTQITVIKESPVQSLAKPIISGLDSSYCNNLGLQKIKIVNIPASFYQAEVSAQLDSSTLTFGADSSFSIDPSSLSTGQHHVSVFFSNDISNTSSINNFKVIPSVTPQIRLNASTSTVTSGSSAITVTATNVSGGGNSPEFVFATDRLFNNTLQQSSTNNELVVQASSLKNGDNWIYARMKTSDTCYTSETVTDSIRISKNVTTAGMTDPDFPDQMISTYPNPFKHQLTISGLQATKAYTIALYSADGRQVFSQNILNQQHWQSSGLLVATGVYILKLYDGTKNRMIGTITLVGE